MATKKILVACEESQAVCKAFRKLGAEAYSADIQSCSGSHPEWHIKGDCMRILNGGMFRTQDGKVHRVEKWDLIIAHPPCTYLTRCGATHLYPHGQLNEERYKKGLEGRKFFMSFFDCKCPHLAIENPTPLRVFELPKESQVVQPYEYGNPYTKRTLLWLRGLPELKPTKIVDPLGSWVAMHKTPRQRSKTFSGIAEAMANQWLPLL